jgi:hypothetical protein
LIIEAWVSSRKLISRSASDCFRGFQAARKTLHDMGDTVMCGKVRLNDWCLLASN